MDHMKQITNNVLFSLKELSTFLKKTITMRNDEVSFASTPLPTSTIVFNLYQGPRIVPSLQDRLLSFNALYHRFLFFWGGWGHRRHRDIKKNIFHTGETQDKNK